MHILHLSAECYPVAKVGGLGDVVGALPHYLEKKGADSGVLMPKYQTSWIAKHQFETIYSGTMQLGAETFDYAIEKETENTLGFPLYMVNIPQRFSRPGIYLDPESGYGYWDEFERYLSFQLASLEWINSLDQLPDVIHCHDHHSALTPFLTSKAFRYNRLRPIPTILTIHNAEYHGGSYKEKYQLLPPFNLDDMGLLFWGDELSSLAAGIKTAWKVTTVSPSYMEELKTSSGGLESLFGMEAQKCTGIINGIDTDVWNPVTDRFIANNYSEDDVDEGKQKNKAELRRQFNLQNDYPLVSFIGRLVHEKGADLLPDLFEYFLQQYEKVNFIVLGTGRQELHERFKEMRNSHVGFFDATLSYNEALAHQMYAGSDFMIIPSRVEPCGLNQMYAMRYGTIPIVRSTGGLKDTVVDVSEPDGYGIRFNEFTLESAIEAVDRAIGICDYESYLQLLRQKVMNLNFSWEKSAGNYLDMYTELINKQY